jgi:hypothetical protein
VKYDRRCAESKAKALRKWYRSGAEKSADCRSSVSKITRKRRGNFRGSRDSPNWDFGASSNQLRAFFDSYRAHQFPAVRSGHIDTSVQGVGIPRHATRAGCQRPAPANPRILQVAMSASAAWIQPRYTLRLMSVTAVTFDAPCSEKEHRLFCRSLSNVKRSHIEK